MKNNIFKSRRFKHGTLATVMTIVFVAVIVLVNVIATILLEKFPLSIDLTKDQTYSLSDEAKDYLKKLETEVNIHVLLKENELTSVGNAYYTQIANVFKQLDQHSDKVTVDYIDLDKNPRYGSDKYTETLQKGSVIIESKERYRVISNLEEELLEMSYDQYYGQQTITGSNAEPKLLSAILYVTDKNPTKVVNLTGFNEVGASGLISLMENNGYVFDTINIMTQDIPSDADLLLIAAPTIDYTQNEIDKLENFLNNKEEYGKNLIYVASANQKQLPVLEGYLKNEWNIEIGADVIIETDSTNAYMGMPTWPLQSLTGNLFVDNLPNYTEKPFFTANIRPVTGTDENTTKALVQSADTCVLMPVDADDNWSPEGKTQQAYTSAVASIRSRYKNGTDLVESKVVAFGSDAIFVDQFLKSELFNNGEYTVEMFNTLTGKDASNTISIVPKTIDTGSLGLTNATAPTVILVIFVIIVPILTLLIGLAVWLRRRNK